ncbi:aspartate/glutamate racemase family protein [Streptomyces sp. CRN 30]|uniref:aspartate/glutamate racemase family protein n=1 Tax=Streptomyces sp. CRN 30 TaxID=3075613 RepID=UPI002A7F3B84|nr:aspartate/glutamate racemase family protein [Streptomyces sp. CRN 30]
MLALLHTSPVHVPVFDALRDEVRPGLRLRHSVAEGLLDRARAEGPEAVAGEVRAVLEGAVAEGARAVLCTCSTLGAVAEAARPGVPVLRVDRPMAAAAVATGARVTVVAALRSTLRPTAGLIAEEAARAGAAVAVRTVLVPDAWEHFTAGDTARYERAVATAVDTVTDTDVVVLAQASMAPAERLVTTSVPVLSSPRPGFAAAADAAEGGGGTSRPSDGTARG